MLLLWGFFTLLLWIVSFRLSKAVWSIFLLLTVTFFLLACGDFGCGTGKLGGWFGMATGIAMGLVESALKDRWLYVTAGPLAGKQFILYKPQTVIGSSQSCDIYLFKDPEILPQHATLELKGSKIHFVANGTAYIAGQPVRGVRVLENGVILQLGRYGFRYQERQR